MLRSAVTVGQPIAVAVEVLNDVQDALNTLPHLLNLTFRSARHHCHSDTLITEASHLGVDGRVSPSAFVSDALIDRCFGS